MAIHIDVDDPKHRNAAAEILRRHDNGEPEANITSRLLKKGVSVKLPCRWSQEHDDVRP